MFTSLDLPWDLEVAAVGQPFALPRGLFECLQCPVQRLGTHSDVVQQPPLHRGCVLHQQVLVLAAAEVCLRQRRCASGARASHVRSPTRGPLPSVEPFADSPSAPDDPMVRTSFRSVMHRPCPMPHRMPLPRRSEGQESTFASVCRGSWSAQTHWQFACDCQTHSPPGLHFAVCNTIPALAIW